MKIMNRLHEKLCKLLGCAPATCVAGGSCNEHTEAVVPTEGCVWWKVRGTGSLKRHMSFCLMAKQMKRFLLGSLMYEQ